MGGGVLRAIRLRVFKKKNFFGTCADGPLALLPRFCKLATGPEHDLTTRHLGSGFEFAPLTKHPKSSYYKRLELQAHRVRSLWQSRWQGGLPKRIGFRV